jgi:uncharacterized protein (DUF433 family)
MANLDWSQCPDVESIPGKVSGAWIFRNSRMPVKLVFENLEDGMTIDEITEQYDVTREQVKAVIDFAARSLERSAPEVPMLNLGVIGPLHRRDICEGSVSPASV